MIETIISNNCAGGAIMHELGMEFKSPTINLQILPEQYWRFCEDFWIYMHQDLKEIRQQDLDQWQQIWLRKMFGGIPDMPYGMLSDILVCFQHYESFDQAKAKWDERAAKIDYHNIGFIMHARGKEYDVEAAAFAAAKIPNKLLLTEGFELPGSIRFDGGGFDAVNGKLRITQVYDFKRWRETDGQDQDPCNV